ncbi:hypothetical protein ALC62_14100 [Cyphomyrmex costatus]|uniref:Uncharacterized protein n=1 Tax=Cyphomyrmex costatus TaxID=456900 RepID=A0A195C3L3_9HYME|nr:hypothetical protein ALC62_14100 [Cyphomyrmex costatus]
MLDLLQRYTISRIFPDDIPVCIVVGQTNRWMLEKRREPVWIFNDMHDAHNRAYVHVAFNGCRRSAYDGKGGDKGGGYIHVAVVVIVGDGSVVILASSSVSSSSSSSSSGATSGTAGREEKREMMGWKGERRGAEAVEGRVTRDDDGVNTPVISLKCTWVQPRAEALTIVALEKMRERERERERLYHARNRDVRK